MVSDFSSPGSLQAESLPDSDAAGQRTDHKDDCGDFPASFCDELTRLFRWRRDVRHFRTDPVPESILSELLDLACLAPSVGNSQPWRFVRVDDTARRQAVRDSFTRSNQAAAGDYEGEQQDRYLRLKLQGMDQAPVHLAVFCVADPDQGHGLGRRSMPETLQYSTVAAIHTLWLAARARNIGLGWVSILEPERMNSLLEVPEDWRFVAWLCLGYPQIHDETPELVRKGWQDRDAACRAVLQR